MCQTPRAWASTFMTRWSRWPGGGTASSCRRPRRGYDDPSAKYPARQQQSSAASRSAACRCPLFRQVQHREVRLPGPVDFSCFIGQISCRGLFVSGLCGIMVSTSPPFCGVAGTMLSKLRRVPVKYWLMDLNPDQMIVMGKVRAGSLPVRVFEAFNRMILRQASEGRDARPVHGRAGEPQGSARWRPRRVVLPNGRHESAVHDIPPRGQPVPQGPRTLATSSLSCTRRQPQPCQPADDAAGRRRTAPGR